MAVTGTIVVDGIVLTVDQVERAAKDLAQGPDVLVRLRPQLARKLEALMGWNVSLPEAIRRFVESGPGPLGMDTSFGRSALTTQEMDTVRAAITRGLLNNVKQAVTDKALQSSSAAQQILQKPKDCNKLYRGCPMPGAPTPAAVSNGYKSSTW